MKPLFAIGSVVLIGDEQWRVVRYHQIAREWEVLFRSMISGVHRSIPCSELEAYARSQRK